MRALDFLEPLPVHRPDEPLAAALRPLEAGTPVAYTDSRGWRLIQPLDAVAFPSTRQLCDLPSRRLPTISLTDEVALDSLAEHEVWGAMRSRELVGRVDSLRVLSSVAAEGGETDKAVASAAHDRLMPRLLHDLANALTLAMTAHELPRLNAAHAQASSEALRHASAIVNHMRSLYTNKTGPAEQVWELARVIGDIESMLVVAARPALLTVAADPQATIRGQRWRLESVLLNLVLNASELADNIRIEIGLAGRQRVEIRVEDDGPGFSDEVVVAGAAPTRSLHGHGLPSIRRQVIAMGGRVRIESAATGGARVRINLPRAW